MRSPLALAIWAHVIETSPVRFRTTLVWGVTGGIPVTEHNAKKTNLSVKEPFRPIDNLQDSPKSPELVGSEEVWRKMLKDNPRVSTNS